jgi:hypothetical protein
MVSKTRTQTAARACIVLYGSPLGLTASLFPVPSNPGTTFGRLSTPASDCHRGPAPDFRRCNAAVLRRGLHGRIFGTPLSGAGIEQCSKLTDRCSKLVGIEAATP